MKYFKIKFVLPLAISFASCATSKKTAYHINDVMIKVLYGVPGPILPITTEVDAQLRPYYDQFINDASIRRTRLNTGLETVKLVSEIASPDKDKDTRIIGVCIWHYYENGVALRNVEIVKSLLSDPIQLKLVVYHELGHCLLNLDHTPNNSQQIMDPISDLSSEYASKNWNDLVNYEFSSI